jgi:hypothetical protein
MRNCGGDSRVWRGWFGSVLLLVFLGWAIHLEVTEGFLYPLASGFQGDFRNAVNLEVWSGSGLFYGPIFVLEWRLLLAPGRITITDLAILDYVLFGVAFVCTWLALFRGFRPWLLVLVLAAWLANHATVALFASAQHLEALELALFAVAGLLMQRGRQSWSGLSLGLAIVTKTLPIVFLPYLVVMRKWRAFIATSVVAGIIFVGTCVFQNTSLVDGAVQLLFQGPNLTKTKATAEEYSLTAFFVRLQGGGGDAASSPRQAEIAFLLHAAIALIVVVVAGFVLWRCRGEGRGVILAFGLIEAVLLVVTPSSHIHYFVFLLPAWTAVFAELLHHALSRQTVVLWAALVGSYVLVGFDQPFVLLQRVTGLGQPVLSHWVDLNPLGLLLGVISLVGTLVLFYLG